MTLLTEGRNEMDSYPTAMTEGAYFALVDNKTGDVLGRFVDPAAAQRVVSILNSTRGEPGRFRVEDTRPAHLRAAS